MYLNMCAACVIRYPLNPIPLPTRIILIIIYSDQVQGFNVTTYTKLSIASPSIDDEKGAPWIYPLKHPVDTTASVKEIYTWTMRRDNGCLRQVTFHIFLFIDSLSSQFISCGLLARLNPQLNYCVQSSLSMYTLENQTEFLLGTPIRNRSTYKGILVSPKGT